MTDNINENNTVSDVTNPKSLMTGIGDINRTMNPHIVVPADKANATPVVDNVLFIASQGLSPTFDSTSNLRHTCIE